MFARLLLLFILIPLVELFILLEISDVIGTGSTILIIIATGFLGAYLAKQEGLRTLFTLRQKMQQGQLPAEELVDGLIILIAGAVLLTPGVLTDLFGFMLLFRPTRKSFKDWLKNRFSVNISQFRQNSGESGDGSGNHL